MRLPAARGGGDSRSPKASGRDFAARWSRGPPPPKPTRTKPRFHPPGRSDPPPFPGNVAGVPPEALRHRAAILRPDGVAARPRKTRRERIPGSTRWAGATATLSVAMKWGRSRPLRCFALVQNQRPRETQPQCSVSLPFAEEVNGSVNRSVNRVFHAPFTFPRQKGPLNLIRILPPSTSTEASETKM